MMGRGLNQTGGMDSSMSESKKSIRVNYDQTAQFYEDSIETKRTYDGKNVEF